MMMMSRSIARALRDSKGLSAVEFALIAPLLAFVVVALADAANYAVAFSSMQRAERAGMQYFMNGGTDLVVAKGIVTTTWKSPPSGYTVTTTKVCSCSSGVVTCGQANCADGGAATTNMKVSTSATIPGSLMSLAESKTESVRVQ